MLLLSLDFLDELYSGAPFVGAPEIEGAFALGYGTTVALLLVVPQVFCLLVEPPLFVLADRHPRRPFVSGGLAVMGACGAIAALAPNPWVLTGAVCVSAAASGIAINLAQATLMDAFPDQREQMMTRWTLMGMLGDLSAPALFAALAWFALGWRTAYAVVGAVAMAFALVLARRPFPALGRAADAATTPDAGGDGDTRDSDPGDDDPVEPGVRVAIRAALGNRRLLLWLLGVALCDLMDEICVMLATLHMRDLGLGPGERAALLACDMIGAAIGLVVTDAALRRFAPLSLLAVSALLCAGSWAAWLATTSPWVGGPLLFVVGASCAPLYPIAMAQVYRAMPGRSGLVNAAGTLFAPLGIAMTLALGWIADAAGTTVALAALTAQPLGLWALARLLAPGDAPVTR